MGMFDSLYIRDLETAQRVCDSEGFPMWNVELQTKDWDCELAHINLHRGQLYCAERGGRSKEEFVRVGESLCITTRWECPKLEFSGSLVVYTHSPFIKPVVVINDAGLSFRGPVTMKEAWCEWDLRFDRGRLSEVHPLRMDTRESVMADVKSRLSDGDLMDDDDRVAKKAFRDHVEALNQKYPGWHEWRQAASE